MIVEKVMRTLTSRFDHVIVAILESNNLETMKLEDLTWKKRGGVNKFKIKRGKIQSKKSWSNPQKHKLNDRAYKSSKRGERNSYQKDKEEKKGVQCYSCEKWGHLAKNCCYRKYKGAKKGNNEVANLARQDSYDYEDMVVMAAVANDHVECKILFLDTSCLNHMTGRKLWLTDFDESMKRKDKLVDNSLLQVEGTSDIIIQMNN
ncbi:uncharacterized protein LOC127130746 [Lathyrus oleraceus]|uniref:uncharacterized protein LOC127130746 n=1 Tax=Pisum sativum TaxID=3888 RepID=UPI0021D0DDCF|nr:uncharacterized protein LOC127130746 [Pisum sativum]